MINMPSFHLPLAGFIQPMMMMIMKVPRLSSRFPCLTLREINYNATLPVKHAVV